MTEYKRVMISAIGSNCGKTILVSGLLQLLKEQYEIAAFKSGPDYIDPMYHRKILGVPSTNLDTFFCDKNILSKIFCKKASSLNIIEGAMGLYDGTGITAAASSYTLAKTLNLPIILMVDCKGMANGIIAIIKGFLSMDTDNLIKGIFLNRISKGFYEQISTAIEEQCNVAVVGYLPEIKDLSISSRHLGLKSPEENDLKANIVRVVDLLKDSFNMDLFMKISESNVITRNEFLLNERDNAFLANQLIAVSCDEAFSFCYEENLDALREAGAKLVFFSPISDESLPCDVDGVYLTGGYPELYLDKLSANKSMHKSIREFVDNGGNLFAECGGFMYLHQFIDGKEMVGIFDGEAVNKNKLVRFGYVDVKINNIDVKGHEFHHYDVNNPGEEAVVTKASNGKVYKAFRRYKNCLAGFPHLYFYGNREIVKELFAKE